MVGAVGGSSVATARSRGCRCGASDGGFGACVRDRACRSGWVVAGSAGGCSATLTLPQFGLRRGFWGSDGVDGSAVVAAGVCSRSIDRITPLALREGRSPQEERSSDRLA
jgi:hypothetical protein